MPNLSNFVVSLALLALCLPGRAAAPSQHPFQLPPDAKIHIGKPYSVNLEEEKTCNYFVFSERAIRNRLRTYHVLHQGEFHASFQVYPCRLPGTITLRGKTYHFEVVEGNLIDTDYPQRPERLGGLSSDSMDNPVDDDLSKPTHKRR